MNQLDQLLLAYREDTRIRQITQWLDESLAARIQLTGVAGAIDCFIVAGATLVRPRPFLLIAGGKEEAAYLQNTLANLRGDQRVHFFPDSFKSPGLFETINGENIQERTETIDRLNASGKRQIIVISYPEALLEKVVSPKILEQNRLIIQQHESLDVDTVISVLVEYGFTYQDFVYEPGHFSVRGGIVDIFSYGNNFPYRIELFDDEVESIRTFDPLTQRSVDIVTEVVILPDIRSQFSQADKIDLFQTLPADCVVWVKDHALLESKLVRCFDKAEAFMAKLARQGDEEAEQSLRERSFLRPEAVMAGLSALPIVALNEGQAPIAGFERRLNLNARSQPSFNKNFELLIQHLNENKSKGIFNYLFTHNAKQVERFYAIFEDIGVDVQFQPVLKAIHQGFIDVQQKVACYTDHQIFDRFHRYQLRRGFTKDQAANLTFLRSLHPGDYVTHIDHGIGRYSGLEKLNINGREQESVRLIYKNNDILYVSIHSLHKIAKYVGKEGAVPKLDKLGSEAWKNLKKRTKAKVKDIASELIKLYAKRKAAPGFAFPPDGYLQNELEASFVYEDTPDQLKATNEVKEDMISPHPMDRLICGDVGFGKTEVAIRAAFKCVEGGKQVAVLAPTTILALQHFKTFRDRLEPFGVSVDYVNRFRGAVERKQIFQRLEEGKLDLIIGTHALLSKGITFKDLGLLIIDEEQKFGVAAKEKLRNLKINVDTLTLTATPIPRTLQFSLMAARDLSVIRTPPPNRQPIHTEVRLFSEGVVKEAVQYEVDRGGQVFFVHNRVKNLLDVAVMVRRLCPDVSVAIAHGQMEAKKLEQSLIDFIDRRYDVLVCTNIIETGLDIPNANTIIINNAQQFGLSDLHQLRGRVGRSNQKAYCYLFTPPLSTLNDDTRKRLQAIEEFSDLGSGFQIAMRDLDIRGAGNLLGAEQSGFIADIGFDTYQKILEEAIQELKEEAFRDLFQEDLEKNRAYVREVQIDTDVEMLIPDEYVSSIEERLNLYTQLNQIEHEEGIAQFQEMLRDRFGRIPPQVMELFEGLRLRWVCKALGFERVILKNDKLRCYFVENPQSPFYESQLFQRILDWMAAEGARLGLSFKRTRQHFILVKDGVKSLRDTKELLDTMMAGVETSTLAAS